MPDLIIDINLCNNSDFIYINKIKKKFIWNEYGFSTPTSLKELQYILNFFRKEKMKQYSKISKFSYNKDDIDIYHGKLIVNKGCNLFVKVMDPFMLMEETIISHKRIDYHHLNFVNYTLKKYMSNYNEMLQYMKNIPPTLNKFIVKIKNMELFIIDKSIYDLMEIDSLYIPKIIHTIELEKINGHLAKTIFYYTKNIKKYFMSFYLQGLILLTNLNRNGLLHMDIKYNNIMLEFCEPSIDILNYKIICKEKNVIFKLIDLDNVEVHSKYIFPYDVYLFMKQSLFYLNRNDNLKDISELTYELMLKLDKGEKYIISDEGIAERSIDLEQCEENYNLLDNFICQLITLIKTNKQIKQCVDVLC